jgi:hypothetical protein
MKYISISVLVLLISVIACKKGGTDGGGGTTDTAPTNLTVTAVVNPDNSGNVTFTAGASNAITFDYDFGNGIYQTVASGIVTYRANHI